MIKYPVIEFDAKLAETAGQLVGQYPLRAYDAVQLASVLRIQPAFVTTQSTSLIFLTADNRLMLIFYLLFSVYHSLRELV